jgi:hypothetical protein
MKQQKRKRPTKLQTNKQITAQQKIIIIVQEREPFEVPSILVLHV